MYLDGIFEMFDWLKKKVTPEKKKKPTPAEEHRNALSKEKTIATKKKEPWVAVLDTQINPENIRNGFFELDWNEYFVLKLRQEGYGYEGDPDEEIVDRWFRDLARNVLAEEGQDTSRGAGYINVVPIDKGKSEVS